MLLAPLDQSAAGEDVLHSLVQRFGPIEHDEHRAVGGETTRDQILQQPLARPGVLGGSFPQAENVLVSALVDAQGREHDMVLEVDSIDHQDGQFQVGQVALQQLRELLLCALHEAAAHCATALAALRHFDGQPLQRTSVASRRDPQDHLRQGTLLQRVLIRPMLPGGKLQLSPFHRAHSRSRQHHSTASHHQRACAASVSVRLPLRGLGVLRPAQSLPLLLQHLDRTQRTGRDHRVQQRRSHQLRERQSQLRQNLLGYDRSPDSLLHGGSFLS